MIAAEDCRWFCETPVNQEGDKKTGGYCISCENQRENNNMRLMNVETMHYVYDRINNIVEKDGLTYTYGSVRPHAVTGAGQYGYVYDANGNMTQRLDGGVVDRVISYDYENRVSGMSDGGVFNYDDSGRRVKKVEDGVTTYYFFTGYEVEDNGSVVTQTSYYFANGQKIAQRSKVVGDMGAGQLMYSLADHLGSTSVMVDAAGAVLQRSGYAPYGELLYLVDGSWNSLADSLTDYMYTGQELDGNGIMYYGARYYDPVLGRFLQADTVLDGTNRYAYCRNNPIKYVDPTGNSNEDSSWMTNDPNYYWTAYAPDWYVEQIAVSMNSTSGNADERSGSSSEKMDGNDDSKPEQTPAPPEPDSTPPPCPSPPPPGTYTDETTDLPNLEDLGPGELALAGLAITQVDSASPGVADLVGLAVLGVAAVKAIDQVIDKIANFAAEHTNRKGSKKKTNDKHTKSRPGRDSEKKKQKPGWKKNK